MSPERPLPNRKGNGRARHTRENPLIGLPAAAQDDPLLRSIVKLERSAEPEIDTRRVAAARPPAKLQLRRLYAVLQQVVVPAYVCCEPPEQFTLTARNLFFQRGRSSASLSLYANGAVVDWSPASAWNAGNPRIRVVESGEGLVGLEFSGMKPNHYYLVDWSVTCRSSCRFEIYSRPDSHTMAPTDGHLLVLLPTDATGKAATSLRRARPSDDWDYSVHDVVVSEIGPVR